MGFFTDKLSTFFSGVSNAVGKIKKVGSVVGKHITKFSSMLTPEATDTPNLSGLSRTLALMSSEAYKQNRSNNIDGYTLDNEISNYNTAVYYNSMLKNVIIAFRGTAELKDLKTDIDIAKGSTNDSQFKDAIIIYNLVKQKYPDYKIITTGHSKGGSQSLYLNSIFGVPSETFNAGTGLGFLKSNPNSKNAILHIIKGDAISALAGLGNLGTVKAYNSIYNDNNPLNAHSMKNFIS
jgi:hypothetical protein